METYVILNDILKGLGDACVIKIVISINSISCWHKFSIGVNVHLGLIVKLDSFSLLVDLPLFIKMG